MKMSTMLPIVLVSVHTAAQGNEGGEWINLTPLSIPRQEVGAARIDGQVYVVGGLVIDDGLSVTDTVEIYDIASDTWSFAASLPIPLHHAGVARLDGILYVMGGFLGDARIETWAYDPQTDHWMQRASMPEPRGAAWSVSFGGRIYVFGGDLISGFARQSTFIYDPLTNSWTIGADVPTPRQHLNAVAVGEFIYVIGGRDSRPGQPARSTNVNERYDPATNTWQSMTPMPTARSAMATAAFGNRIFVAGGEIPILYDVNEVYDIATDTWSCQAPMPIPRHRLAAVTLDDRILMPAGGVAEFPNPTNAVDSFVPDLCEGDANADGTVDPLDSGYVLARFGCPVGTDDPSCDAADVNGDGEVNPLDIGFVLARFGECP